MNLPIDLKPIVGETELRHTVNSDSRRQAMRKTKRISRKVKAFFRVLEEFRSRMPLSQTEIDKVIRPYINEALNEAEKIKLAQRGHRGRPPRCHC